jgi:hypothetical protein
MLAPGRRPGERYQSHIGSTLTAIVLEALQQE